MSQNPVSSLVSKYNITTPARPKLCQGCQELILSGWSGGVRAVVDPYPLTPEIERLAHVAGRLTYLLLGDRRLIDRVGDEPHSYRPVLMSHRCGFVLKTEIPVPLAVLDNDVPPF